MRQEAKSTESKRTVERRGDLHAPPTDRAPGRRHGARRKAAGLALMAAAFVTTPAAAHERWVQHALLRSFDRSLFEQVGWTNGLTALALVVAIVFLVIRARPNPAAAASPCPPCPPCASRPIEAWMPALLRVCYGVTLIAFAMRGAYLAPDLCAVPTLESRLLVALAGATGVLLIAGFRVRTASLLSLVIFAWALVRHPFEPYAGAAIGPIDVLAYAEVVGIVVYLAIRGAGRLGLDGLAARDAGELARIAKGRSVAGVRIALGGTLVLLGVLKFLRPEIFMGVVQNYPEIFHEPFARVVGASEETVVFGASVTEITLGLFLALGLRTRGVTLILGMIFAATACAFREEVLGHLPLIGMVAVLLVEGGGSTRRGIDGDRVQEGDIPGAAPARTPALRRPATAHVRTASVTTLGVAACLGLLSFRVAAAADHAWVEPLGPSKASGTFEGHRQRCAATLVVVPGDTGLNRFFTIELELRDADTHELLSDVEVTVDVTMPQHGHGMPTTPQTRAAGPGRFVTRGCKLHMYGAWLVQVEVRRDGRPWDRFVAAYELQPAG